VNVEVVNDYTTLHHVIQVELTVEGLLDDGLVLATVELIEHIRSEALEGQLGVSLAHAALQLHDLTH
jgi:hypothetical protein